MGFRGTIKMTGTLMVGALGLGLAAHTLVAQQQQAQQTVPDAPRPQTLPTLDTVTPVGPSLPSGPASQAQPSPDNPQTDKAAQDEFIKQNGGIDPSNKLPIAALKASEDGGEDEGPAPPPPPGGTSSIIVHVNYVQVPVTVKDSKNHLYAGLHARDFRIYENGVRQNIYFWSVDPFPLSVAMVIDQSVDFQTMQKINTSLHALQAAFTPYDEVAVFTYNNGVSEQTTFTAAQGARLGVVLDRSKTTGREMVWYGGPMSQTTLKNDQQVDPNTAPQGMRGGQVFQTPEREYHTLNDAILTAAAALAKTDPGRRRVLYVLSDGKEYGSKSKEKDVIKFLQAHNIEVYATLVGDSAIPGAGFLDRIHLPLTMRDDVLPRYAAATGGQCDPEFRPQGIQQSFQKISEEVRTQYTLGYYSHESVLDGKYRTVEVRVLRPNLEVISKKGYYPTASARSIAVPQTQAATP